MQATESEGLGFGGMRRAVAGGVRAGPPLPLGPDSWPVAARCRFASVAVDRLLVLVAQGHCLRASQTASLSVSSYVYSL